jgi:hypothetical protein
LGRRITSGLLLAIAMMILTTASVSAKLDATLSVAEARPGDIVTLMTGPNSEGVSQGGQAVPVYLLAETSSGATPNCDPNFWDEASAKVAGATLLGSLSWDHTTGIGTLSFKVPAVPAGSHPIAVLAPNASPGCWPEATLTVLAAAPLATGTADRSLTTWVAFLSLIAGGVGALVVGIRLRRRRSAGQRASL